MPHVPPSTDLLDDLITVVSKSASNKRQNEMASQIVAQYNKLMEYVKDLTQELNLVDSPHSYLEDASDDSGLDDDDDDDSETTYMRHWGIPG